jgi:hypothetical protein
MSKTELDEAQQRLTALEARLIAIEAVLIARIEALELDQEVLWDDFNQRCVRTP